MISQEHKLSSVQPEPISWPKVTIVVIGQNEGSHLHECFQALQNIDYPKESLEIIFVDSKSTDDSAEIAKKYTDHVFCENSNWPTAGEAFNRGIRESTGSFIHITAGDILLDRNYLKAAISELITNLEIQTVTGYFIEKTNKGWNKIIGYRREDDTDTSDHYVMTPNGGTFRKEALLFVNGYDERIKKGQETELGLRFKKIGYKILYKHIPQGIHDFELSSFTDLAKKYYINGYSLCYSALLSLTDRQNNYFITSRNYAFKILLINTFFLMILAMAIYLAGWWGSLIGISVYLIYYPISIILRKKKNTRNHKYYLVITGYLSFFSYIGLFGFLCKYLFLLIIRKENLLMPHRGLKD